jgi:hypothetical protein
VDPTTALIECDQAISDCDLDTARDRLAGYREWRKRDGWEPLQVAGTLLDGDKFADECERRITDQARQARGGKLPANVIVDDDMCDACKGERRCIVTLKKPVSVGRARVSALCYPCIVAAMTRPGCIENTSEKLNQVEELYRDLSERNRAIVRRNTRLRESIDRVLGDDPPTRKAGLEGAVAALIERYQAKTGEHHG